MSSLTQFTCFIQVLNWFLSPVTSNTWLNIYMQIQNYAMQRPSLKDKENFVIPRYSQQAFVQVSYLLDLCSLDIGCLQFSCSILAASAMYHMLPVEIEDITGWCFKKCKKKILMMLCHFSQVSLPKVYSDFYKYRVILSLRSQFCFINQLY